ncbi:Mitochondrial transcription termination factor family protein [Striga hermonthica]|uniref:Mitochondrial transcription termination factor family protein n=1 Tax=Striga hermonthica TaxID=68872 RepID=A0A9N7P2F3_STRHE|nr:Mitochondrial transcription termination factor family protein [Striga hermonthica]
MALHALLRRNLTSFFSENLLSPSISNGSLSLPIAYFSTAIETKPSTPPSVYEFLTNKHNFPPQVASRAAPILSPDLEKIIKPKIQVFQDFGFPSDDIAAIISKEPGILQVSLENKLVPALSWLKDLFGSTEKVTRALKQSGTRVPGELLSSSAPGRDRLGPHGFRCRAREAFPSTRPTHNLSIRVGPREFDPVRFGGGPTYSVLA